MTSPALVVPPIFTPSTLPDPKSWRDSIIIFVGTDGSRVQYISDGFTWNVVGAGTGLPISTVQSLIAGTVSNTNAALAQKANLDAYQRSAQTGDMPAVNVVFNNGLTLETRIAAAEAAIQALASSTNAPIVTGVPTITGTMGVGNTLTAGLGAVTNGSGGAHTDIVQWVRQNPTNPPAAIPGATALTYKQQPGDLGFFFTVTQQAKDTVNGLLSNVKTSLVTAIVTGTVPTVSVVPAITPSGSSPVNTPLTTTTGTFTGGSGFTFGVQWYLDPASGTAYAPVGPRTSALTQTPATNQTGTWRTGSICTNSLGLSSVESFSNQITITGAVTVSQTTPVALAATVTATVAGAITPAVWALSGGAVLSPNRSWAFYLDGASVPYRTNTVATYTPEASHAASSVIVRETVTETTTGLPYTSTSAAKTIQAVPVALAASTAVASTSVVAGQPVTAWAPVTAFGGTQPYGFAVSPPLPASLVMSPTTGQITGTPAAGTTLTATVFTVTVTDNGGSTPATATFTLAVGASVATPLPVVSNAGVPSGGTVADPVTGATINKHIILNQGNGVVVRDELFFPTQASFALNTDYWYSFSARMITPMNASAGDDTYLIQQTHTPANGDTQPPISFIVSKQSGLMTWRRSFNTKRDDTWNYNGGPNPDSEGTVILHTEALFAPNVTYAYAVHVRPNWDVTKNPIIEIWRKKPGQAWAKIVTDTGPNEYNIRDGLWNTAGFYSYLRIGLYGGFGVWNGEADRTWYLSPMHFGQGVNLLASAQAAVEAAAA